MKSLRGKFYVHNYIILLIIVNVDHYHLPLVISFEAVLKSLENNHKIKKIYIYNFRRGNLNSLY